MGARRAAGFTLLEILVALLVLGVVGGALLELFHGGLRNVAVSADYTDAALLARSKLAELELRTQFAPLEEGQFNDRFRWRIRAADYLALDGGQAPTPTLVPVSVELTVSWDDGASEREYAVGAIFLATPAELTQ